MLLSYYLDKISFTEVQDLKSRRVLSIHVFKTLIRDTVLSFVINLAYLNLDQQ